MTGRAGAGTGCRAARLDCSTPGKQAVTAMDRRQQAVDHGACGVAYLHVRHPHKHIALMRAPCNCIEEVCNCPANDPLLCWCATHGVGLAAACLPIRKHCAVVAIDDALDKRLRCLCIHALSVCLAIQDTVQLVCLVACVALLRDAAILDEPVRLLLGARKRLDANIHPACESCVKAFRAPAGACRLNVQTICPGRRTLCYGSGRPPECCGSP